MVDPIAQACGEAADAFEELQTRAGEAMDILQGQVSNAIEGILRGQGFNFGDFVRGIVGALGNAAVNRSMDGINGILGGIFEGIGLPGGSSGGYGTPPFVPSMGGAGGNSGGDIFNFNFPPGTDTRGFQQSQGQLSAMVMRTVANGRRYG